MAAQSASVVLTGIVTGPPFAGAEITVKVGAGDAVQGLSKYSPALEMPRAKEALSMIRRLLPVVPTREVVLEVLPEVNDVHTCVKSRESLMDASMLPPRVKLRNVQDAKPPVSDPFLIMATASTEWRSVCKVLPTLFTADRAD